MAKNTTDSLDTPDFVTEPKPEPITTADASGVPAGVAFTDRMDQAKFELRNLGHEFTISLLEDLFAGIQRLEAAIKG